MVSYVNDNVNDKGIFEPKMKRRVYVLYFKYFEGSFDPFSF